MLLPFYVGPSARLPFSTVVIRCRFDGHVLSFIEHGNLLSLDEDRGLYEPSLIRFGDRWYLTIRSDRHAYVSTSRDGLHFRPVRRWRFDDGTDLGSHNTQQHWVHLKNGLFLIYTRRGLNNDHIIRHRAPLLIAQVDPQRLHVIRSTEQVLVPERGAMLGNFGAVSISTDEAWVTVSEFVSNDEARRLGADGSTFLVKVTATDVHPPGAAAAAHRLQNGADPVKIVCFGNSVTGLYYHTGGRRTYTDLLGQALKRLCPSAGLQMINAGISGHTTAQALERMERDVLAHQPDLVTVMFGLNDVARLSIEDYRRNLEQIVDRIRAVGSDVILCTPNAVMTTNDRPVEKLEQYCQTLRAVAKERHVTLCDCHDALTQLKRTNPNAWRLTMSDEIHPNLDGHRLIAEQLARTITGRPVSLSDPNVSFPALPVTMQRLAARQTLNVLAMGSAGLQTAQLLNRLFPGANLNVETWDPEGKTLPQLTDDAEQQVRPRNPHLVIIAVPRTADATSREEFIRSFTWILNWSLPFGRRVWDVVVVHPNVTHPEGSDDSRDELIRRLTRAADLPLIDRKSEEDGPADVLISRWLKRQKLVTPATAGPRD